MVCRLMVCSFFQAGAKLHRLRRTFRQCLRPGEVEDPPAARNWIEAVDEIDYRTIGFEQEWQRTSMRRKIVGQASSIFGRLRFDACERSFGFRLNGTNSLAIEVEQVVREAEAGFNREIRGSRCRARRSDRDPHDPARGNRRR